MSASLRDAFDWFKAKITPTKAATTPRSAEYDFQPVQSDVYPTYVAGVHRTASRAGLGPDEGGENLRDLDTLRRFRLAVPITDAESSGRRERVAQYSEHIELAVLYQVS